MDLLLLRVFQHHVLTQCEFMLLAAAEVNAGLKNINVTQVFGGLQSLLNAAANASKALWGQGGKYANQRKELRDSIGVADSSPLRTVTMRNNFEHFDERIDKWWNESRTRNIVDFNIGSMTLNAATSNDPLNWFRSFDRTSSNLYFWGQEFNVQELINEAKRILPKLREEANKPHWETEPKSEAE